MMMSFKEKKEISIYLINKKLYKFKIIRESILMN